MTTILVSLRNFKKFADAEFKFDQHLTLISGKSGQGKTTIFNAIIFALTGAGTGTELKMFGKSSATVTLTFKTELQEVIITRKLGPASLVVEEHIQGQITKTEEDEAQAVIDRLFPNYKEGYMSQSGGSTFVDLSDSAKVKYIQRMAFGSDDPEVIYKRCLDLVSSRKRELDATMMERKTNETLFKDLKMEDNLDDDAITAVTQKLDQLEVESSSSDEDDEMNMIDHSIQVIDEQLKKEKVKQVEHSSSDLERTLEKVKKRLTTAQHVIKMRSEIEAQLTTMPKGEDRDFDEEIKAAHLQQQKWERYQKEQKKLAGMEPSGWTKEEIEESIKDMNELIALEKELKQLSVAESKLAKLTQQISQVNIPMTCPACDNTVSLWCDREGNATLVKPTGDKTTTFEEAKKLEKQHHQLQTQVDALHLKRERHATIMQDYSELEDASQQLEHLLEARIADEAYNRQRDLCFTCTTSKPTLDVNVLKEKQRQKFARSEKEATLASLKTEDDPRQLEQEIASLMERLKQARLEEEQVKEHNRLLAEKRRERERLIKEKTRMLDARRREQERRRKEKQLEQERLAKEKERLVDLHQQAQKFSSKVKELSEREAKLLVSHPRAEKLKTIIKRAERLSVEEVVDQVNLHAQIYLDHFLEGVTAALVFGKPNREGGDTLYLDIKQTNGTKVSQTSTSCLSGGEKARVVLAFTVAMAEVSGVRLLMLDECVASLDQDTTTTVVETLRSHFGGTIICIAHQTTTGIFDRVINL